MKKKNQLKKLTLNKQIISKLNQEKVIGGIVNETMGILTNVFHCNPKETEKCMIKLPKTLTN